MVYNTCMDRDTKVMEELKMEDLGTMIAKKIKAFRKASGMTRKEFAAKLNYAEATIEAYERGVRRPSIDAIEKIIVKFELPPEYFLGTIPGSESIDDNRLDMMASICAIIQLMPNEDLERILKHLDVEASYLNKPDQPQEDHPE